MSERAAKNNRGGALLAVAVVVGAGAFFADASGSGATGSGSAARAAAVTTHVRAQSVGRFVDGSAGGTALESIVDVQDARATNPGTVTDQNPLAVSVGGQQTIPLTGALRLPGDGNAIHLGAANQVAEALSDGYSYGASGAVANSGGASLGANDDAYPSNATIDLSASAVSSSSSLPALPGGSGGAALGSVTASVGAISALASTPKGFGRAGSTAYDIGSLELTLASPALGDVLSRLSNILTVPSLPASLPTTLPTSALPSASLPTSALPTSALPTSALPTSAPPTSAPSTSALPTSPPPSAPLALPASCAFKSQALPTASVSAGAITIDPRSGSVTIDVEKALQALGANINDLPANTDVLAYVLKYLSSSDSLAKGLQTIVCDTLVAQQANFGECLTDLDAKLPAPLSTAASTLIQSLTAGQDQLSTAIDTLATQLSGAAGADPFAPLTNGLEKAVRIGVNVQPNGTAGTYQSPLAATPDQATDVVSGQTVVRAIEFDLGGGQLSLALANAAAGPSSAALGAAVTHAPDDARAAKPAGVENAATALPTGVPAGRGTPAGTPVLPLVLFGLAGALGLGAALSWRLRRAH